MRASFRRLLPLLVVTAVLAACERAPSIEPTEPPPAVMPAPATPIEAPVAPAPPPPPSPPAPPRASDAPAAQADRLPLVRILAIAQRRIPGEVLTVDLDEDDDDDEPPTYELEILTPDGRVMEIRLDARTGDILEIEED